ncbi:MAG: CoA transferase [Aquabacterium sp.]|nr:CoA transferase [Aquabacterium sp.]
MTDNPSSANAALAGVRVIDLTSVVFGPYATQALADYGADVIKVEGPEGDSTRRIGPAREPGMASIFLGANRNKRSVVLDLKSDAGRAALLALTDSADVFIHNVRPQSLQRLGLSAEVMRARNPRLVFVGLHGFGEQGPYAGAPAYDDIIQALSGAADLIHRQSGQPGYFPTIAADKVCGLTAVHAVLAALFQRERSGQGQVVEVPMFESMASFLLVEHLYARHLQTGPDAGAPTAADVGYPRSMARTRRPYRTADGHACVMPYSDENWRRFFAAVERPDLAADPRFATLSLRTRHIEDLLVQLTAIIEQQPSAHWQALCERLDIPFAPINRLHDLEHDPHLQAVGFFQTLTDHDGQDLRFTRPPVRLSASQVPATLPPRLGQHSAEVLGSLGLAPELLAQLLSPAPGAAPGTAHSSDAEPDLGPDAAVRTPG